MTTLLITEKPSVAIDIAKVLSEKFSRKDGYLEGQTMILTWAVGHLVEMAEPHDYDPVLKRWSFEALPILPDPFQLKAKKSSKKQLKTIQNLIKRPDVERLVNACDAGREGELIFRNIIQFLNCRKPHDRLWLSETTPAAVRHAFAKLRNSTEVESLGRAAVARSQADWLIGINATRAYTVRNGDKLTVGRVQTPTLAFIINREREIENFVPVPYYKIEAEFLAGQDIYKGKWFHEKEDRFTKRSQAQAVLDKLLPGSPATVTGIDQKEVKELPPQLYNLNDLQKDANKRLGLTAEQTLKIAQKLYEAHLLTYPRTDSRHLTQLMADTLQSRLNALRRTKLSSVVCSIPARSISDKRYVDDSKVTDHTAIIVTDTAPVADKLRENEYKIYLLVARRMVGMFLPPARYLKTTIITTARGETFISKGKTVIEAGWKSLYPADTEESEPFLPALAENQKVSLEKADILDKQTQAPKRYTEADLLSAMENAGRNIDDESLREVMKGKGLGTPATRAAVIEKLISTAYVMRMKKVLIPTKKGKYLIDKVAAELKDPEMTGEWEQKLLDIEQGKYHSKPFMDDIKAFTRAIVEEIKKQEEVIPIPSDSIVGVCPLCGKAVIEGKKAYGCTGWQEGCKFVIWKAVAGKRITAATAKQLLKTGKSDLIQGFKARKGGQFEAYLSLENGMVIFEFPSKKSAKEGQGQSN
jgi:DNA topoisomerase-3